MFLIFDTQVRWNQHAMCCNTCNRWQHRLCHTNISKELYVETMNGNGLIAWHCQDCGVPNTEDPSSSNLGEPALESTRPSEAPRTSLLPDQDHDSFEEMETNVPEEPSDDQEEIEEEEMEEETEVQSVQNSTAEETEDEDAEDVYEDSSFDVSGSSCRNLKSEKSRLQKIP